MFDFESFIAKSKLYFQRAAAADDDDERALWQLLAFEFSIRAPLAHVSPALLASEGDSVLHAVGVPVEVQKVTSISSSLVLARLAKVIADFGKDGVDAGQLVLGVRNTELHTSQAAVASTDRKEWLPAMLSVLERVFKYLDIPLDEVMSQGQIDEASAYRETARNAVLGLVGKKIQKSKDFFAGLNAEEVKARVGSLGPLGLGLYEGIGCPACGQESMVIQLGPRQATSSKFDEDSGEIIYEWTAVVVSASCEVCGLSLDNTAEAIAAGLSRTHRFETSESRYEGWQDAVPMSEIEELVEANSYDGAEYMDE